MESFEKTVSQERTRHHLGQVVEMRKMEDGRSASSSALPQGQQAAGSSHSDLIRETEARAFQAWLAGTSALWNVLHKNGDKLF